MDRHRYRGRQRRARGGSQAAARDGQSTRTPGIPDMDRRHCCMRQEKGHEAVVRLLLATGRVDLSFRDNDRRTPLWHAVRYGCEVVKLLFEKGAESDSKDNGGRTPLSTVAGHRYEMNRHETMIKLLL